MDRLSILLTLMTGAVLTGTLVIAVLSLGFANWTAIGSAAAIGWLLAWPAAYVISRRIKRQDEHWDDTRIERTDMVPRPSDPEV